MVSDDDRRIWADPWDLWHVGGVKVFWIKPNGSRLTVTGHRLEGDAPPLHAFLPSGYSGDFQASGLYFPTGGRWAIAAGSAGSTLHFVVWVRSSLQAPFAGSCATLTDAVRASQKIVVGWFIQREEATGDWTWESIRVVDPLQASAPGPTPETILLLQNTQQEPVLIAEHTYLLLLAGEPQRVVCPAQTLAEVVRGVDAVPRLRLLATGRANPLWSVYRPCT